MSLLHSFGDMRICAHRIVTREGVLLALGINAEEKIILKNKKCSKDLREIYKS